MLQKVGSLLRLRTALETLGLGLCQLAKDLDCLVVELLASRDLDAVRLVKGAAGLFKKLCSLLGEGQKDVLVSYLIANLRYLLELVV